MSDESDQTLEGGCTCGAFRYEMTCAPMFVNCCHCHWCQRETGSCFAVNAAIEADRVTILEGSPNIVATPSNSGKGQNIWRCPDCCVALWSTYAGAGDKLFFVRVGTLDEAHRVPPDIHIFTASKQPWVVIPPGQAAVEGYYRAEKYWPKASLERRAGLLGK